MIHTLDLQFHVSQSIAAFVVESSAGPILVETGPHSTYQTLCEGLAGLGYQPEDVRHVLLSHIHFDHAGAAWAFAKSGATVYVHPRGWKHLQDPTRLYNSAKRIYGDQMEALWGLMEQIEPEKLIAVEDEQQIGIGDKSFTAWHTPGHASHHIVWQLEDVVFTGDVAGCKVGKGPVVPPCPPPDINLEDWENSIAVLRKLNPSSIYLTHFGEVKDVSNHLDALSSILWDWANWMKPHWEAGKQVLEVVPAFKAYAAAQLAEAGVPDADIPKYEAANPAWMSVAGLMRYWQKKAEASAASPT
ncbi:MAG: MBL fold metallo-hydrolase [Bacteroidota bacterium]